MFISDSSCLLSHISCPTYPVPCLLSHACCLMSTFFCLKSPVSCPMCSVSCLLSHVFCLTSPVSCFLCHVSCLTSPVSCLLSHVSWHVPCFMSQSQPPQRPTPGSLLRPTSPPKTTITPMTTISLRGHLINDHHLNGHHGTSVPKMTSITNTITVDIPPRSHHNNNQYDHLHCDLPQ